MHRYSRPFSGGARGPAIFNPSGRMPTEAFNYQFPVGSVRDDQSDSTSSSSGTVRTQRTEGTQVFKMLLAAVTFHYTRNNHEYRVLCNFCCLQDMLVQQYHLLQDGQEHITHS